MAGHELTCICCPMGCALNVTMTNGQVTAVRGHTCHRGLEYAIEECMAPTRMVTSVVPVINGHLAVLPVKTEKPIPKEKITECISALKDLKVTAPVKIGDVIVNNVAATAIPIVATRNVAKVF